MLSLILKQKSSLLLGFLFIINFTPLHAQQEIIINKDNTRPETNRQLNPAHISSFITTKHNGYNEIQWSAMERDVSHKFFVEYSFDGIDFMSAGQVISNTGTYNHKHYITDTRPLLYRIRIDAPGAKPDYSNAIFLDGVGIPPVQVYTNVVKGDIVNARAQFPVERVTIVSGDGQQVFAKDVNGSRDFIPIAIPALKEGLYFITFYGNNWKSTSQFFYQS